MPRRAAADYVRPIVSPLPKRLKPPETLSEGARAEFLRVVTTEKADHFRQSDLSMLCQYCEACSLAEEALKEARCEAPPNRHWLAAWREATRTMKDFALRLRLSPQSRQTHNHTRPEPRLSYYDREALGLEDETDAQ
jgi:phage terminase small subunit